MKRYLACFLGGILAALLVAGPALAVEYNVSAKGKNEKIATTNAGVNAVRTCMKELVTREFLQAHADAVRLNIILKSSEFVTACTILEREPHGAFISVRAVVDVDRDRLKNSLDALQSGKAPADRPSPSEPGKAGPATLTPKAEKAMPTLAPATKPMEPEAKSEPVDDAVPALPPVASPKSISPEAAPKLHVELYVSDLRQALDPHLPPSCFSLMGKENAFLAELLAKADIHDLQIVFTEHGTTFTSTDKTKRPLYATAVAVRLEKHREQLQKLLRSELTFRDFVGMFAIDIESLPEKIRQNPDRVISVTPDGTGKDVGIAAFNDIFCVKGLFNKSDTQYIYVANDTLVASDQPTLIAEVKGECQKTGRIFYRPDDAQIWGRTILPVRTLKNGQEVTVPDEIVFSMKVIPEGWAWSGKRLLQGTPPLPTISRAQLPLVDSPVYGSMQPSILAAVRGNALQDLMVPSGPEEQLISEIISAVDTITFGIGAAKSSVMGIPIPACPYVYLTGKEEALAGIMQVIKSTFPGKWEKTVIEGWPAGEVNKNCQVDDVSVPLAIASKAGALALAMTDSTEFLKTMRPAKDIVRNVIQAYAPGIQCSVEKAEVVTILDVKKLWQEIAQVIGPGSALHPLIKQSADAKILSAFNRLCCLVPPVLASVGWENTPGTSEGYILMNKAGSTEFFDTLADLINAIDKQ